MSIRGTSYLVIAREMQEHYRYPIVLVTVDGRLCELHKQLKKSCRLEFITLEDDIGHKTYQRSLTLLLLKAMYHVAGHEQIDKIVVQYSMGSGYYCTVQGKVTLDQEFLDQVKAYMRELVDRKLPIMKKVSERRKPEKNSAVMVWRTRKSCSVTAEYPV